MKRALRFLLAAVAVVAAAFGYVHMQEDIRGLPPGSPAPTFRLPSLAGGEVDLQSLRGRLVVLNFWATWCAPCVAEMPSLERLYRALGREGLTVLSVSVDEDETALRFTERAGLTFPILRDPGGRTAARAYRASAYPQTVVIDAGGQVKEHWRGPAQWDTPEAIEHFRGLLTPAPARSPSE